MLTTALQLEFGCLRHPGASAIGSQLLDGDRSYGWQILATQPWAPKQKGKRTGTHHTDKTVKDRGKRREGEAYEESSNLTQR